MEEHGGWRLGQRPGLDGLRGFCALMVVAAHFTIPTGAGVAGLTTFFVLSGFLITALLVEELQDTGRIAWPAFYLRRIRRLIPALVVVLAATMVVAVLSGHVARAGAQALGAALYIANFGPQGEPLGHAWSLSVEEQFYGVWPAVVIGASLVTKRWRLALLGVAGLAFLTLFPTAYHASAFGAIAAGCAVGIIATGDRLPRMPASVTGAAVGAMFVASLVPVSVVSDGPLRVPVTLAAAVIVASVATQVGPAPLEWGWIRAIGRISYGIYLWHIPIRWTMGLIGVEVALDERLPGWGVPAIGIALAATFVFAVTSDRWIEQPFRRRRAPIPVESPAPTMVPIPVVTPADSRVALSVAPAEPSRPVLLEAPGAQRAPR